MNHVIAVLLTILVIAGIIVIPHIVALIYNEIIYRMFYKKKDIEPVRYSIRFEDLSSDSQFPDLKYWVENYGTGLIVITVIIILTLFVFTIYDTFLKILIKQGV